MKALSNDTTSMLTSGVTSVVKGHEKRRKDDMLKTNVPIHIAADRIKWAVNERMQSYGAVKSILFEDRAK